MPCAILTGATSGIGRAITENLLAAGWKVGLLARTQQKLQEIQACYPQQVIYSATDLRSPIKALSDFSHLASRLGFVDRVYLNAAMSTSENNFDWAAEEPMILVNVHSFTALAHESSKLFLKQGAGHLIGISSVVGVRGTGRASVYAATKAYGSIYLQGLRQHIRALNQNVYVTDIRPGFIDTPMVKNVKCKLGLITAEKAAQLIEQAAVKRKRVAYIPFRWQLAAALYRVFPEVLCEKIYGRFLQK